MKALSEYGSGTNRAARLRIGRLAANYAGFHTGLTAYLEGISRIGCRLYRVRLRHLNFHDGVDKLYDGIVELHDGTNLLNEETANLPDKVQSEIDALLEQYGEMELNRSPLLHPKISIPDSFSL